MIREIKSISSSIHAIINANQILMIILCNWAAGKNYLTCSAAKSNLSSPPTYLSLALIISSCFALVKSVNDRISSRYAAEVIYVCLPSFVKNASETRLDNNNDKKR